MPKSLRGDSPSRNPETMPASSSPVPVADSQFRLKTAASGCGFETTGGARSTRLCSQGTCQVGLWIPLNHAFTWGSPQVNTKTESRIHGIQAIQASRRVGRCGTGSAAAAPIERPAIAGVSDASSRSWAKRQVLPGCQNRSSATVQAMEEAEATMSTTQGPWKLL